MARSSNLLSDKQTETRAPKAPFLVPESAHGCRRGRGAKCRTHVFPANRESADERT